MSDAEDGRSVEPQQQVLRPRNAHEALKIAETRLRKVGSDVRVREARTLKQKALLKDARKRVHVNDVKTPEKLLAKSIRLARDAKRARSMRLSAERGQIRLPGSPEGCKSLLVIRNSKKDPSRETRELLSLIGLRRVYSATLLPNSEQSLRQLRLLRDFVFWGSPDEDQLQMLFSTRLRFIKRRGTDDEKGIETAGPVDLKNEARREVLQHAGDKHSYLVGDNVTVEERLGHVGMLCVDDIRCEVSNVGPAFTEVKSHLAPFELADILKGVESEGKVWMGKRDVNKILRRRIVAQPDAFKL